MTSYKAREEACRRWGDRRTEGGNNLCSQVFKILHYVATGGLVALTVFAGNLFFLQFSEFTWSKNRPRRESLQCHFSLERKKERERKICGIHYRPSPPQGQQWLLRASRGYHRIQRHPRCRGAGRDGREPPPRPPLSSCFVCRHVV